MSVSTAKEVNISFLEPHKQVLQESALIN